MKTKIIAFALSLVLCLVLAAPAAMAQIDIEGTLGQTGSGIFGGQGNVPDSENLPVVIGNIINIVLGFLGVIMVVIIIYGGFLYMTAGGNPDQVDKAKKWIINAIIGLIIILLAYSITAFVVSRLAEATGVQTT